jgi:hypothetical protein
VLFGEVVVVAYTKTVSLCLVYGTLMYGTEASALMFYVVKSL